MSYQLSLRPGFTAPRRIRAGIEIPRDGGVLVADLTEEQLAALQADPEIRVTDVADEPVDAPEEVTTTDEPVEVKPKGGKKK